ncbi:sensor histidine kinase [Methylocapsa acidiphila]|uniref:sensor histidine kinase n=1 Tax=Methylocapsa acidiphila TaxID=133552 RepID=UPI0003FB62B9|nr:sensor histidine kinase KdpD [Methylocapsa acidiphila]
MEKRDSAERRPSPDALLRDAQQCEQGRLKIFLGAAPGVGKTYEMLTTARAKKVEGLDVVVGVVETHGRKETEALLQGLEIVPRRSISYRGHGLTEMDLDAILARRPRLVLVDELAHTNAPESRHPKRYMDVEELLAAGIDVYTTLNIQHVESLNDVVARITRVRVRETVPDSIIDRANDIEVVDLTPEDLIERLHEGKVYVPDQAQRAVQHYFSPGNLTALRELALRRTAQRVDEQMVDYMRLHAIEGPWPAGEQVLVLVDAAKAGNSVVRYAKRMADRLRGRWAAIHVETPADARMSEAERDRVAQTLRLAQRLGAEAISIPGQDVADTVAEYARANNFAHIIIAKSERRFWRDFFRGTFSQKLIRIVGDVSVHVIARPADRNAAVDPGTNKTAAEKAPSDVKAYLASLSFVVAATLIAIFLRQTLGVSNVALSYLLAILASAVTYGLWASLLACLVSLLAYNFFFLPPLYTFTITDPENVVALFFFAAVAIIASNLGARLRAQAIAARQKARITEELYLFSRKLAGVAALDDVLWATAHQIALMLKVRVVLLLPEDGGLAVKAGFPPEDALDDADLAAARWCFEKNQPTGRGADTLPGAKRRFMPLRTGRGAVGVVGVDRDAPGLLLTPEESRLFDALSDQAALAIDRVNLAREIDRARLAEETERLRSALLTSISHDLRTPLASIIGSATSLVSHGQEFDEQVRASLMRTIQEEAERLNRFIGNLLDMTRLESGPLRPQTTPTDLSDVIGATLQRAAKILQNHEVSIRLEDGLPMLEIDMVLMEQVLFNLFDNAAKYAPLHSQITITARREDKSVVIRVLDEGEGIPDADLDKIFDKFYRVRRADRQRAGTGLGLAICRGFVEAMGGSITAGNRIDRRGALFTITLPARDEANPGAKGAR